jgi:hypothetical protein
MMEKQLITFIATAYKEKYDPYMLLASLLLQKDDRWNCIVYSDEPNPSIKSAVKHFKDKRIKLVENEVATGFWGHYNRKKALEEMVDSEFVIQTSIQNYYTPNTVSDLMEFLPNQDLIFFDCIHSHHKYNVQSSEPKISKIDWGSFAVRTSVAKQVGINNPESIVCDGIFVESCMKVKNLRYGKINKILTVHN